MPICSRRIIRPPNVPQLLILVNSPINWTPLRDLPLICPSDNEITFHSLSIIMCLLCVYSYATLSTGRPVSHYNVAP